MTAARRPEQSPPPRPSYVETLSEIVGVDEGPRGLERVVRVEGDGIVWSCLGCGADNGVRASRCHSCGLTFASTARRVAREETTERAGRGERVAADALRAMAVAGRAGPLGIPLVIAAGIVAILRGIVRALLGRRRSSGDWVGGAASGRRN